MLKIDRDKSHIIKSRIINFTLGLKVTVTFSRIPSDSVGVKLNQVDGWKAKNYNLHTDPQVFPKFHWQFSEIFLRFPLALFYLFGYHREKQVSLS